MDKIAKAIIGAVITGSGAYAAAAAGGHVTAAQYVAIGAATIVAFFGVWAVPNAPQEATK